MVTATICIVVVFFAVMFILVLVDNKRRRGVREAALKPGISRAARREVIREQRSQDRKAQAQYKSEHPYLNSPGGGEGGGL